MFSFRSANRPSIITLIAVGLIGLGIVNLIVVLNVLSGYTTLNDSVMRDRGTPQLSPVGASFRDVAKAFGTLGVILNFHSLIRPFVYIVSGIFLLAGYGWARWLFLLFSGSNVCIFVLMLHKPNPTFLLLILGLWALVAYLLTNQSASVFFETHRAVSGKDAVSNAPVDIDSDERRI